METDNAYVKAHIIAVSAEVAGRVIEVGVRDNQPVAAGALLFRIDPAPFEVAVARAEAQMAVVRTELDGCAPSTASRSPRPRRPRSASASSPGSSSARRS